MYSWLYKLGKATAVQQVVDSRPASSIYKGFYKLDPYEGRVVPKQAQSIHERGPLDVAVPARAWKATLPERLRMLLQESGALAEL